MRVLLSEDELSAMAELPLLSRCVYVFGIRPYMDYSTGIVGERRGVSWQSLAEACFVHHHQGRQESGTPHRSKIRRAVSVLEKEGLVVIQSEGRRLVFHCPLAATDQSEQEKADRRPTDVRHTKPDTQPDTPKAAPLLDFTGKADKENGKRPTHPDTSKADKPPESGKPVKTTPSVSPPSGSKLDLSVLPSDLSEAVWRDWLQHRKDKKAPVKTQTVVNTVAKELEKARAMGWTPDDALAETMAAGWQGVKAEWLANRTRRVAGSDVQPAGHNRRGGFSETDYRGEAKQMGFRTVE